MSGTLSLFISKEILHQPRKLYLAVTDCSIDVDYRGTLRIQTKKGNLTINSVFYFPGVEGAILSVGREEDWKISFDQRETSVISPDKILFETTCRNYCWYTDLV